MPTTYAWCFDPNTQNLNDIEAVTTAFVAELEKVHNSVTDKEWADIFDKQLMEDHYPSFKKKPDWSTYYKYNYGAEFEAIATTRVNTDYKTLEDAIGVAEASEFYHDGSAIGGAPIAVVKIDLDETLLFVNESRLIDLVLKEKQRTLKSIKSKASSVRAQVQSSALVRLPAQWEGLEIANIHRIATQLETGEWINIAGSLNDSLAVIGDIDKYLKAQAKKADELKSQPGNPGINLESLEKNIKELRTELEGSKSSILAISDGLIQLSDNCTLTDFEGEWNRETAKLGYAGQLEEVEDAIGFVASGASVSGKATSRRVGAAVVSAAAAAREAAFADNIIFREQCFLLANLADLVEMKKAEGELPLPYIYPASGSATTPPAGGSPPAPAFDAIQNHPIHVQGTAFAFMNKLAVHPSQKYLFDVNEADLSKLTPRARFFKVEKDQNGKDYETEIEFDTNVTRDLESYMTRGGRGLGVGVRSFSFDYDGTDPFSAKKAISAKLVIRASSFSDLLRDRGRGRNQYKYVDLALRTGTYFDEDKDFSDIEKENLNKLNFRLRVLVEWTSEKGTLSRLGTAAKDALYNSAISIYLTPTIHEFDFDETGALDFTINYLAYVEDFFSTSNFDVFGSVTAEKTARDLTMDFFRREDCDVSKSDEFAKFREFDETYISTLNQAALSKIIQGLRVRKKIKYLNVTREEIRAWLNNPRDNSYVKNVFNSPPVTLTEDIVSSALTEAQKAAKADGKEEPNEGQFRLSLIANSNAKPGVAFFYLSDLLSVVMNNIETAFEKAKTPATSGYFRAVVQQSEHGYEKDIGLYIKGHVKDSKLVVNSFEEEFKRTRVVLGPMEVTPYGKTKTEALAVSCTLGDIPIGLNYFLDFMSAKVLGKDFIQYPFSKFIKEIITDCIKNYINSDSCFGTNASQKVSLNSSTIMAYNTFNEKESEADDQLTHVILESMKDDSGKAIKNCLLIDNFIGTVDLNSGLLPILKISGPRDTRSDLDIEKARNYYVFTIGKRYPVDAYTGSPATDAQNGIFHYVLGADKGIVRNISLDKTNTPGLKEVRFEQEGYAGLEQLREVYNANISTFLNPQTFPGTYIYVEPKGFDPTALQDLTRFGIGGYYMITKTSHKIEPGNNETSIYAQWVSSKGGDPVKNEGEKREVTEGTEKQKKCKVESLVSTGKTR